MGRHSSHHSSHSSRSSSYRSGGTAIVPVPLPAPVPVPVPLPAPVPESCYRERREDVDLVRRFNRECRNSGYPTRYIVNDGTLVINESLLNDSNTLIYNRRGSNMCRRVWQGATVGSALSGGASPVVFEGAKGAYTSSV
ncbi:hypothetical protein PG995_000040 [Apiospora arundinis]